MDAGSPGAAAAARVAARRASHDRRRRRSSGGTPAQIRAVDSELELGHAAVAPSGAAPGLASAGVRNGSDGKAFEEDASPWAMPSNRSPKRNRGVRGGPAHSIPNIEAPAPGAAKRPGTVALTSAAARLQTKEEHRHESELHASLGAAGIERLNTHQQLIRKQYADRARRKERKLQRAVCITALVIVVIFAVAVALVMIYQPGKEAHEPCTDVAGSNCTKNPPN